MMMKAPILTSGVCGDAEVEKSSLLLVDAEVVLRFASRE